MTDEKSKLLLVIPHPFIPVEAVERHAEHDLKVYLVDDPENPPKMLLLQQGPSINMLMWPLSDIDAVIEALLKAQTMPAVDPFHGLERTVQ